MDRVVERGEFKVMVGGVSPSYKAHDHIKDSLKYNGSTEGITGRFTVSKEYAARFEYKLQINEPVKMNRDNSLIVKVANEGNLTDVGELKLYHNGKFTGESHRFEIDPGADKEMKFSFVPNGQGTHEFVMVGKYSQVSKSVIIK